MKNLYLKEFKEKYGVDLNNKKFENNKKWSDRVREVFLSNGKKWDQKLESEVKYTVANCVKKNPSVALNEYKRSAIDALAYSLENLISRSKK